MRAASCSAAQREQRVVLRVGAVGERVIESRCVTPGPQPTAQRMAAGEREPTTGAIASVSMATQFHAAKRWIGGVKRTLKIAVSRVKMP